MARVICLLAALAPAAAFVAPAQQLPRSSTRAAVSSATTMEMSPALPFLPRPDKLKGWVGDVGFDPVGMSEWVPVEWLREAELKHSRVAMLAALGYVSADWFQARACLGRRSHR
jgi:hypothetical protein